MEIEALKAQLEAARRCTETVAGVEFALLLPTEHSTRVAMEAARTVNGPLQQARAVRSLLDTAVVGWKGLTARHLLPEAAPEPIEFSPASRELLLDSRQDIADALGVYVMARQHDRAQARQAAEKNS